MEKKMYYEAYEILEVNDGVDGNKRVMIKVGEEKNDNLVIDVPEWEFACVVTDEPSDASTARNKIAIVIVDELYEVLKGKNARIEDISYITQKLMSKLMGIEEKFLNDSCGVENKYEIRIKHFDK